MIADVSGKLVKQFADCLAQTIASEPCRPRPPRRSPPHRLAAVVSEPAPASSWSPPRLRLRR